MFPQHAAATCAGQLPVDAEHGVIVYQKPALQRFGTLRDLTLIGLGLNGAGLFLDFDFQSGEPDTGS